MTEEEWLGATEPAALLDSLQKPTERKLRLFGVACCRRIMHLLRDQEHRRYIEVLERHADSPVSGFIALKEGRRLRWWGGIDAAEAAANQACTWLAPLQEQMKATARNAALAVSYDSAYLGGPDAWGTAMRIATLRAEQEVQAHLIRDIFGNPFHPLSRQSLLPLTENRLLRAMAEAVYAERTFEDLLILADALEEAGCDSSEILNHCRAGTDHVRGCWVVDLLLEKEERR